MTFAAQAVHQLLTAYSAHRAAFTDATAIPESGGGMLAHAATVFGAFPALRNEAADLKNRALAAWQHYQRTATRQTACDSGVVHAGLADLSAEDQNGLAVEAAAYLFALTSDPTFETYLADHYKEAHPYHDIGWSRYKPDQGDALLFYASLPGARPVLAQAILADKLADVRAGNQIYGFNPDDDLYRVPQQHDVGRRHRLRERDLSRLVQCEIQMERREDLRLRPPARHTEPGIYYRSAYVCLVSAFVE